MGLFSVNSPLMRALNLIADILILHFLWLLCSIPLITIGASTTALYYACMKRIRTNENYIVSNFFRSFKSNFRQSTIIWIIMAASGILLAIDFRFAAGIGGTLGTVINVGCAVIVLPWFFILLYIFPVQAKFENPIRNNIKNALLMSFRHFPLTLALILIDGSFLILGFSSAPIMGIMLICGAGILGYLTSLIFVQIFRNYIPGEIEQDIEFSGETFEFHDNQ